MRPNHFIVESSKQSPQAYCLRGVPGMSCRSLIAFALALLLAACATPLSLKPGTSIDEARLTLGRPTAELKLPDGGTRLQYSGQPFNQSVVNADFDAQGRLRVVEQMMTDESFARVRAGKDTQADVLRDFGPPGGHLPLPPVERDGVHVPLLHARRVQGRDVHLLRSGRRGETHGDRPGPVVASAAAIATTDERGLGRWSGRWETP